MSKSHLSTPQESQKAKLAVAIGYLTTSPIGPIGIWATPQGVIRLTIGTTFTTTDQKTDQTAQLILNQALQEVAAYLVGQLRQFTVPINWQVISPRSRAILEYTFTIPYGEVRTYGEIAQHLGRPNAARAVGSAMAYNPIPLIIPCHRVVSHDHRLHGYGAGEGLPTKAWLLQLEGHHIVNQRVV
ncbi:methylated-DNA--[protein]-cysteine S-methyltransferase [uncultured Thermanaerothrix sp.]|uniref:methylated-DNA--[protein]-cysteine S-methyltransferase n=1 Tax=uncultured Thermanaerothrix sp. TaxID=1195149 RepID=UPI0026174F16|nr:methylated-DNA--[protein]-cysteine S-methyltransferase [uncultured Thermanaerothrix sp.]